MMSAPRLTVKPEYKRLTPKHRPEELEKLRQQLLQEGMRDPIRHNRDGVILDGMTRYEIASELGIEVKTELVELEDDDAEAIWILERTAGRRNVTESDYADVLGELFNRLKGVRGGNKKGQPSSDGRVGKTSERLASQHGVVSARTIEARGKLAELVERLPKEIRQQHDDKQCRLTLATAKKLVDDPRLMQIGRAMRVGQAKDVKEAWKQIYGEAMSAKGSTKDKVGMAQDAAAEAEAEEPELSVEDKMSDVNKQIEKLARAIMEMVNDGMEALDAVTPWMSHLGRTATVKSTVKAAVKTLRSCKGHNVCPKCKGKGCQLCYGCGWLDKATHSQLAE